MEVSNAGMAFIEAHEGFSPVAYADPVGILTIGYGFTMRSRIFADWWRTRHGGPLRKRSTITRQQANMVLRQMLNEEYGPLVQRALPSLTQCEFDACVSVVYNLGPRALGWRWAKALKKGNVVEAARLLKQTGITAGGRVLPGLVKRRDDEARMLLGEPVPLASEALQAAPSTTARVHVEDVQSMLAAVGHDPGPVDGINGPRTKRALRAFQKAHPPLKQTGRINPQTWSMLLRAATRKHDAFTSIKLALVGTGSAIVSGVGWQGIVVAALAIFVLCFGALMIWRFQAGIKAVFGKWFKRLWCFGQATGSLERN